jgi:type IV pilus assembly protein PilE
MHSSSTRRCRARAGGFTLIEMMIVVMIIAVLAAIVYPSYTQYVVRSNQQAARAMLYAVADREEQFFLDNKSYAADLSTLGYDDDTIYIGRDGQLSGADADNLTYSLEITDSSATTWTVVATPLGVQADRDTLCGKLSLTSSGQREASGDGDKCW